MSKAYIADTSYMSYLFKGKDQKRTDIIDPSIKAQKTKKKLTKAEIELEEQRAKVRKEKAQYQKNRESDEIERMRKLARRVGITDTQFKNIKKAAQTAAKASPIGSLYESFTNILNE